MRYQGHNVLAIVVAAIAIWAIGFLLYVVLFQEAWMAWMGVTEADVENGPQRMIPWMAVMPFLQATGISMVIKWRKAPGWLEGAVTGFTLAVFIAIAARMYGWVYSNEPTQLFGLDSLHFVLTHLTAGAILGAWK